MKRTLLLLLALIGLFFLGRTPLAWAETSYDPYDPQPKNPEAYDSQKVKSSDLLYGILNAPTLPLRWGGLGVEKTLGWVEKTHFPQKVKWLWEDVLHENGIYPEVRFSTNRNNIGGGGHIELEKLLHLKQKIPFLKMQVKGGATTAGDADFGGSYELSQAEGLKFYHRGIFDFTHRQNETFWGLGPRSSVADGVNYQINTTTLKTQAGFHPLTALDLGGEFAYRHVTVQNPHGDDKAKIEDYYQIGQLPGIDGGEIISLGPYLQHDTRDFPDDPTRGGLRRFGFNFNRDTQHGDNYFKYSLELAQYFRLGSERRVFAAHFITEHVQDFDHSSIPFFDLARLGGYGIQPDGSSTLRGYQYNRFCDKSSAVLNLEYRYNVWQYGNFGADWVFLTDMGKVFGDLHEFGIGGLKVAYGTGLRLKAHRKVFLSLEIAKGNEETIFYIRTKNSF